MALEANLTKAQAQRIWNWSTKAAKERLAKIQKQIVEAREQKVGALKEKWGENYHAKADLASKVAKRFGGEPLLALMRKTRLGDEAEVLETFAAIGEVLSEDVLTGGGQTRQRPEQPQAKDWYPKSPKLK
jgi:uncharacterized protein YycO